MKSSSLNLSEWAIYLESWREICFSLNSKSAIILSRFIKASMFGSVKIINGFYIQLINKCKKK
jgi:hypothetical protein